MLRSLLSGGFASMLSAERPPSRPHSPGVPIPESQRPGPVELIEFRQEKTKAGLLVTEELERAINRVKKNVENIAKECRARNSKFRDIEFDLEEDRSCCLHGLNTCAEDRSDPSDVRRVTQTFKNPQFYHDGPSWSDIVQGNLGDCWLLSGLSTVSTIPSLVEKFCVARDEKVGVYGFVFHRDGICVDVIIDDLLYTSIPKYEELTGKEKGLYHHDKDRYNKHARLGSKSLYFAKSGTENETWVPLVEKAYAKLHGDYASLNGGNAGEAIEDLTGGVSSVIHVNDILDPDVFWRDELLQANSGRLFGCSIYNLKESSGSGPPADTVNGLFTGHAYSILRAVEYRGKKFLRIRNPWGNTEWTGRWSDGSKEWSSEWIDALPELDHTFGDDGAFIMEYEDFLETWTLIHRSRLFDPSWVVSSLWLNATMRGPLAAWDYGDISFTFSLPKASPVIIVLAQLDDRYFREISGLSDWSLDFKLFKKGETALLASSSHSTFYRRSVNAELDLEAGDYVVHVRVDRQLFRPKPTPIAPIDPYPPVQPNLSSSVSSSSSPPQSPILRPISPQNYLAMNIPLWNQRKLASTLTRGAISTSIVTNFDADKYDMHLPRPTELFAGRDLHEVEIESHTRAVAERKVTGPSITNPFPPLPPLPPPAPDAYSLTVNINAATELPRTVDLPQSPQSVTELVLAEDIGFVPVVLSDQTGEEERKEDQGPVERNDQETTHVPANAGPDVDKTPPASPEERHMSLASAGNTSFVTAPNQFRSRTTSGASEGLPPRSPASRPSSRQSSHHGYPNGVHGLENGATNGNHEYRGPVGEVHFDISCDACGEDPIIGVRYKCLDISCPNFDLCANCHAAHVHPVDHRMLMIISPKDAVKLKVEEPPSDDAEDNDVAIGLRVYSKKDAPSILRGQLRHGKVIRWNKARYA